MAAESFRQKSVLNPLLSAGGPVDAITVTIDRNFDPDYGGYVLFGLLRSLGRENLHLGHLGELSTTSPHPMILRGEIRSGGQIRSLVIDLRDHSEVNRALLPLVDVYAKTNLDKTEGDPRCFAIGPTFGIATSRLAQVQAFLRGRGTAANRLSQRATLRAYHPRPGADDYLFFVAWPWAKHPEVNTDRAALISSMRELRDVNFEGGFAPIGRLYRRRPAAGLEQLTARHQYRHHAYLRRLRKSAFAVNTRAVHDCLGWKLGEYLALGKAVISLPLTRAMPGRFEHGEHIHVIRDASEAATAMRVLLDDRAYRRRLEHNARSYWEEYLEPRALVRRLIARSFPDETLPTL